MIDTIYLVPGSIAIVLLSISCLVNNYKIKKLEEQIQKLKTDFKVLIAKNDLK